LFRRLLDITFIYFFILLLLGHIYTRRAANLIHCLDKKGQRQKRRRARIKTASAGKKGFAVRCESVYKLVYINTPLSLSRARAVFGFASLAHKNQKGYLFLPLAGAYRRPLATVLTESQSGRFTRSNRRMLLLAGQVLNMGVCC
jgi:hypothetical protein